MSPTAVTDIDRPEPTTLKSQSIRKPRVYSLEPLHSKGLALAREKFELVLPTDAEFENWRTQAEGLLARNAEVTASDTRELKDNKLRYIAKQGVGVDNFDLDELKRCEIPLMNTPGVNVSHNVGIELNKPDDRGRRTSLSTHHGCCQAGLDDRRDDSRRTACYQTRWLVRTGQPSYMWATSTLISRHFMGDRWVLSVITIDVSFANTADIL